MGKKKSASNMPNMSIRPLSIRRGLRKFSALLIVLFLVGIAGIFVGFPELNRTYEERERTILALSDEVSHLEKRVSESQLKIRKHGLLEFKANALSKRYPVFSNVLDSVYDKSLQYGFKPELVLSVVKVESGFNPKALSYKGACGLMQVNLPVWRKELNIDEKRIFEVDYNLDLGLQILRMYYDESGGNMKRALHLYNNGYLYNNTSYALKVNSTLQQLKPVKMQLSLSGF